MAKSCLTPKRIEEFHDVLGLHHDRCECEAKWEDISKILLSFRACPHMRKNVTLHLFEQRWALKIWWMTRARKMSKLLLSIIVLTYPTHIPKRSLATEIS